MISPWHWPEMSGGLRREYVAAATTPNCLSHGLLILRYRFPLNHSLLSAPDLLAWTTEVTKTTIHAALTALGVDEGTGLANAISMPSRAARRQLF